MLAAEHVRAERFAASYDGDPLGLIARAWDLDRLARPYQRSLRTAGELVATAGPASPEKSCTRRAAAWCTNGARMAQVPVHRPGLPAALLPAHWPGTQAAELFDTESARLLPAAPRFVDCCLRPGEQSPPSGPS